MQNSWPNPDFDTKFLSTDMVAQGIYSRLVERMSTARQQVKLVSPFDIQVVPFKEWQETQVQSQAEMISAGCYSRGKTPLDLARKEGHKKVVRILLNLPAWAPQTMGFPRVFGVGGWNKTAASELENMGYEVEIFWEHTLSLRSISNLQILDECRSHVTRIMTHSTLGYPLVFEDRRVSAGWLTE